MRASVLHGAKQIVVEQRPIPEPRRDEVLIQVAAVGVCGSDLHYFRDGRNGDRVVTSPLVLGHEAAGQIVAVGADIGADRVGQRVAIEPQRPCRVCMQCKAGRYNLCPEMRFFGSPPVDGAFCEFVTIQADFAHPVPDDVSDDAAALMEPLSVGISAARKAGVAPGAKVLIAGAGPIGAIIAQVAKAYGAAEIIVSDPIADRRERIRAFGATHVIDPAYDDMSGLSVDAFIDASGAAPAIVSGTRTVRGGGAVVLVGVSAADVALPISVIQNRELVVTGVYRYANTWPLAVHLVASGQVDLDGLVTSRYSLDDAEKALAADAIPGSLKTMVVMT